jgi:hypothetical protein
MKAQTFLLISLVVRLIAEYNESRSINPGARRGDSVFEDAQLFCLIVIDAVPPHLSAPLPVLDFFPIPRNPSFGTSGSITNSGAIQDMRDCSLVRFAALTAPAVGNDIVDRLDPMFV